MLTAEEEEVRTLVFRDLPPKKVLQVIGVGTWASASPGEQLIERGKPLESIAVIVRGARQVLAARVSDLRRAIIMRFPVCRSRHCSGP